MGARGTAEVTALEYLLVEVKARAKTATPAPWQSDLRTDIHRLIAMVEAMIRVFEKTVCGCVPGYSCAACKGMLELHRIAAGPERELDSFIEAVQKTPLSNPDNI